MNGSADISSLVEGIRRRDRLAVARGLSLVESSVHEDRYLAADLIDRLLPLRPTSRRIGITGSPGVGKSTFIEAYGMGLVTRGSNVAVLAVDPSSRRTGGSILGDKVRMPQLSLQDSAFVRPSPSRTALGGGTSTMRESIIVCEAAGYDHVIVETVGVGQSETEVADMVDMFMVLVLPTAGDELQGIKRGIMEVADVVVVNKADIDEHATLRAIATYRSALRLMLPAEEDWTSEVVAVSSLHLSGIDGILAVEEQFFDPQRTTSRERRRRRQRKSWFEAVLRSTALDWVTHDRAIASAVQDLRMAVLEETTTPTRGLMAIFDQTTISRTTSEGPRP